MSIGLAVILALAAVIPLSESACNVCGVQSGVQCTGESTFLFCQGGAPTLQTGSCPTGTVCADTPSICTTALAADCTSGCGLCDVTSSFACISQTQFALCFGSTVPSTTTGTCASGTVCSTAAPPGERCVAPTLGATCTSSSTTPPTSTTDATATCRRVNTAGSFLVAGSGCKRYVTCRLSAGSFVGEEVTCAGTTLFNPVLQQCVNNYICRF